MHEALPVFSTVFPSFSFVKCIFFKKYTPFIKKYLIFFPVCGILNGIFVL